ncbi:hypothetical protein JXA56_05585 [Candidatus Micrarchaeota archaeon]|nr:hypothetical protein [Candidatus Micrarchaeota archaeon]
MASGQAKQEDAVPLEDFMCSLRKEIEIDCGILDQRIRTIDMAECKNEFRAKYWEGRIAELREKLATADVEGLKELRQKCEVVSTELEEFSRKLE